jgi:cell wall-associated NlpC family hydrolase
MPFVNLEILKLCFDRTVGRVKYLYGAKPPLGADTSSFSISDCSGFVRWALDRAGLTLPDGSATQHEWCAAHLREVSYKDAGTLADPSRLFIAFIAPGNGIGHVWLLNSGASLECRGHAGVSSRPWNSPTLLNAVSACYELPTTG